MTHLPTQHTLDPLTGLPLISVAAAVHRLLRIHGMSGVPRLHDPHRCAIHEKLAADIPVWRISDVDFFRWSDFVRYLEAQMTVQADEA